MNYQQKSLITHSWSHASQDPEELSKNFYKKLFSRNPAIIPLFPKDLKTQQDKLMQSISMLILGLDYLDNMLEQIRELGERHQFIYHIKPEDYTLFGQVLIESIAQAANGHWNEETENAWQTIFQLIVNNMLIEASYDL